MQGISVIIPYFNRTIELPRALESVCLQQTDLSIEVIVVDDCSEFEPKLDNSKFEDVKIVVTRLQENSGASVARNHGASIATYDFVAFLDSDDVWHPLHLHRSLEVLRENQADFCFAPFNVVTNKRSTLIDCMPLVEESVVNYIMTGKGDTRTSTFVMTRDLFEQVRFNESAHKHQDWDFAIRASLVAKVAIQPEAQVNIHVSGDNRMSASANFEASLAFYNEYANYFSQESSTHFWVNVLYQMTKQDRKEVVSLNVVRIHPFELSVRGWIDPPPQSWG